MVRCNSIRVFISSMFFFCFFLEEVKYANVNCSHIIMHVNLAAKQTLLGGSKMS